MNEPISTSKVIRWAIATVVVPLSVSLFAANFYIAFWYAQMAASGAPYAGAPPLAVIQRGVLLTAGFGLWFTVLLWRFLYRKTISFSALFATRTTRLWEDLGLGVLLGAVWVVVYGLLGWPPFTAMFVFDTAKLVSLTTSVSAGFCEEFLFRGFLISLIGRAGGGPRNQVLWSSCAFGLAHLMWGPVGMLFTVVLGASFAIVTLWRGNVWTAVAAHTILDLCIEPGLMDKAMSFVAR